MESRFTSEVYEYDYSDLQVLDIQGYENPWERKDFVDHEIRSIRTPDHIIAFGAITVNGGLMALKRFAVFNNRRRQGLGSRLMNHIIDEAIQRDVRRITCIVRETNLAACMFLKAKGFKAVNTIREDDENRLFFKRSVP